MNNIANQLQKEAVSPKSAASLFKALFDTAKGGAKVAYRIAGPLVKEVSKDGTKMTVIPRSRHLANMGAGAEVSMGPKGATVKRTLGEIPAIYDKHDDLVKAAVKKYGEVQNPAARSRIYNFLNLNTGSALGNVAKVSGGTGLGATGLYNYSNSRKDAAKLSAPNTDLPDFSRDPSEQTSEGSSDTEGGSSDLYKYIGGGAAGGALADLLYGKLSGNQNTQRMLISALLGGTVGAGVSLYNNNKTASEEMTLESLSAACSERFGGMDTQEYIQHFKEASEFLAPILKNLGLCTREEFIEKEAAFYKEAEYGKLSKKESVKRDLIAALMAGSAGAGINLGRPS